MKRFLIGVALAASTCALSAQDWLDTGNPTVIPGLNFLGSLNPAALDIRTENIRRFTLLPDATYAIGGFPAQVKNGSLLLSPNVDGFYAGGAPGPFTGLHLAAATNNTQQAGYRSNMGNGITLTGNNDQMYVGQLFNGLDFTDASIVWSDNPGEWLADRLTFNFTSGYNSGASAGNTSFRGLQTMLIQPDGNGQEAYVGIGDFDAVSATPDERLDVLDGKVRIRELPTTSSNDAVSKYMVVDNTGVVHWRNLPAAATPGCEWYSEPLPAFREVRSGLGNVGTGSCPDRGWLYTIGQQGVLTSKFNIYFNGNERSGVTSGLKVNLITRTGATSEHYGLDVNVSPENGQSASDAYGVKALVTDPGGVNTFGTWGKVVKSNSGPVTNMHGALGWVEVSGGATGSTVYGNYGYSRLVGSIFTNVFGGYAKALVDGSSTVGNSFGVDASSSVTSGSTVTNSFGLRASSSTLSGGSITSISYGVKASGSDGVYQSFGLMAEASGIQGTKFGAYGKAGGAGTNYSVYGASPGNNATDWAGYFPGRTFTPGGLWTSSDESLKAGIEPIQSAVEMILALRPRTYTFQTDVYPSLGLPTGRQYGFLAGELQEQFPEMVIETIHPAQRDSVGNIVHDAVQFSAVNTTGIMPILVAAFREQHLHHAEISDQVNSELDLLRIQVQEQRERMDHLEQALAACCANPDGSRMLDQGLNQPNELDGSFNGSEKLRIQPNPFNERTTVFYTLDRGGRTQLLANSSDGRDLRVLQEANLEVGNYQYDWNTAALVPGMYYVTLLLDGQPVVKKAVKVDR